MVEEATALLRRTETRRRKAQIDCCPGDLSYTHEKETQEGPGPVPPRISPSASTLSP